MLADIALVYVLVLNGINAIAAVAMIGKARTKFTPSDAAFSLTVCGLEIAAFWLMYRAIDHLIGVPIAISAVLVFAILMMISRVGKQPKTPLQTSHSAMIGVSVNALMILAAAVTFVG